MEANCIQHGRFKYGRPPFVPVDCCKTAIVDEWSGDRGCSAKYFSQDGIIKLAASTKIPLDEFDSPAKKLREVQRLVEQGDSRALAVYRSLGVYLGHSLPFYTRFYNIKYVLLLGRVLSGEGGAIIISEAQRVLKEEYPELSERLKLHLPSETSRRVGQSVIAASLPIL